MKGIIPSDIPRRTQSVHGCAKPVKSRPRGRRPKQKEERMERYREHVRSDTETAVGVWVSAPRPEMCPVYRRRSSTSATATGCSKYPAYPLTATNGVASDFLHLITRGNRSGAGIGTWSRLPFRRVRGDSENPHHQLRSEDHRSYAPLDRPIWWVIAWTVGCPGDGPATSSWRKHYPGAPRQPVRWR